LNRKSRLARNAQVVSQKTKQLSAIGRRRAASASKSGRLDLNQRPLGPEAALKPAFFSGKPAVFQSMRASVSECNPFHEIANPRGFCGTNSVRQYRPVQPSTVFALAIGVRRSLVQPLGRHARRLFEVIGQCRWLHADQRASSCRTEARLSHDYRVMRLRRPRSQLSDQGRGLPVLLAWRPCREIDSQRIARNGRIQARPK
jgi:hypothetical protein